MIKILLLEDDYLYRVSIKEFLEELDFHVDDFENGDDAFDAIFENYYDLLLLDIRVPGMDGFSLVEYIRKEKLEVPIIVLTSLTDIKDLSKGYELGCNDYIRKPFDMIELKFRIEQLIKNNFKTNEDLIELDNSFKFDIKKSILYKNDEAIDLSQKESEVVSLLVLNRSFFVSIETLHDRCKKRMNLATNNGNTWSDKTVLFGH